MSDCKHEFIQQTSQVIALTDWTLGDEGYTPDPTGDVCLTKIVSETDIEWECRDCGASLSVEVDELSGNVVIDNDGSDDDDDDD